MRSFSPLTFDYQSAVAALSHMQLRGWRLGLDRMQAFCESLGVPNGGTAKFLHVAGTNGKGSTTAMIQKALVEQGVRTGGYFSPYVYTLRERVQLNCENISQADFARLMVPIVEGADEFLDSRFGGPTEFEAKTALGFLYWQEKQCEAVALEVGLGGRLDATNIIDPAVSVIVTIGFDHMHLLGNTLELIAIEKAGIIKPGRPVVVGALEPSALEAVLTVAREKGSPVWRYGNEIQVDGTTVFTPGRTYTKVEPSLLGPHQKHNAALALAAVEAAGFDRDPVAMVRGISTTELPGRMEVRVQNGQTIVLDGAHNPQAAESLVATLREIYPGVKWDVVTGMLNGHDPAPFYEVLRPVVRRFLVTPLADPRTRDANELAATLQGMGFNAVAFGAVGEAWAEVSHSEHVLGTGSFYLLGCVRHYMAAA